MIKKIILFILLTGGIQLTAVLTAQTVGCTDPAANNFNPAATQNDGSCTYNITVYNPPFRFLLPEEVDETSGLLYYKGAYWTMNDSGGLPVLYKLDTVTGAVIQRIRLQNATNVDWEDLTQDSLFIYVGDFGNNSGNRDDLCIYKVKKADIPSTGDVSVTAEKIGFIYEDYKGPVEKRKDNNFDGEAVTAVGDSLYLFSKDWQDQHTRVYRLPKTAGSYTAKVIGGFNSAGLVTGADYNKKEKEMTLVGYTNRNWIPFLWVLFDFKGDDFLGGNKRRIDMLNVTATQTEGIAYVSGKRGVISSEGRKLFKQTMYNFTTARWTGKATAGVKIQQVPHFDFTLSPIPLKKSKLNIHIKKVPSFNFQIGIFDSSGKQVLEKSYKINRKEKAFDIKVKLGKLKPGMYIVRMVAADGSLEKKFVKE